MLADQMQILLDLNALFNMIRLSFLGILSDIRTNSYGTFAGPASIFMVLVFGPAVVLKTTDSFKHFKPSGF